jgi:hypothetical protein
VPERQAWLTGLARRTRERGQLPRAARRDAWCRLARLLLEGDPQAARQLDEGLEPASAIEAFWSARCRSTCRLGAQAERRLKLADQLPGAGECRELLALEHARLLSYRYRFDEARRELEALLAAAGDLAVQAQAWSALGDALQNDHRRAMRQCLVDPVLRDSAAPSPAECFQRAFELARQAGLSRLFRMEQRLKRAHALAAAGRWSELARQLPARPSRRLPAFHRDAVDLLRLALALQAPVGGLQARRVRHQLRRLIKRHRPLHAPGLLRLAETARLASTQGLHHRERERAALAVWIDELLALDNPADGLDWLDRGLVDHASPLFRRWTDLTLEGAEPPAQTALADALRVFDASLDRHVRDLVATPVNYRLLRNALGDALPTQALDGVRPDSAAAERQTSRRRRGARRAAAAGGTPPFLAGSLPPQALDGSLAFVALLPGTVGWHALRSRTGGRPGLEHRPLPAGTLDVRGALHDAAALGRALFEGFEDGSPVHVLADGAAEQIPFHALPDGRGGVWGARLTAVQVPNLTYLAARRPARRACRSARLPRPAEAAASGFGGVAPLEAYFAEPSQGGVLHVSGHGRHSALEPHLDTIQLPGRVLDTGQLLRIGRDRRLVVLDACHAAGLECEAHENDLGLALAALLGGAELVIGWRHGVQLSAAGSQRGRFLGALYDALHQGLEPATALREAVGRYHGGGDPLLSPLEQLGFLRILGALPPAGASQEAGNSTQLSAAAAAS